MNRIIDKKERFISNWLSIVEKKISQNGEQKIFHNIKTYNYLAILAVNECGKIALVKQYRPSYEKHTIEFPAGLIDKKISLKKTAESELIEETGLTPCSNFKLFGKIKIDTGRSQNYLYAYYVKTKFNNLKLKKEKNIKLILVTLNELKQLIKNQKFDHALHLAVYSLAEIKNLLPK
jgi:8-oxo-dGTP pyrophosphatase MutT (NUDIX family)